MSTQMMNQQIAEYFKTQPVVKAWIFGSYSRNEQRSWAPGGYRRTFIDQKTVL